jgi:L-aminopeptidase/D-esterase-like protein
LTSPDRQNSFHVEGFKLGHWTHAERSTGCTVLLADKLVPAAVEVRGGAPGTRETDLLATGRSVQSADAVLLTGGSAFGLGAADGVMEWLRLKSRGYPTGSINVPIVPGAVIFDLEGPDPHWPIAESGFAATNAASETWIGGRLGGGAGALVSKALGRASGKRSGVGISRVISPAGAISAVFVNNAFGDVYDDERAACLTRPGHEDLTSERLLLGAESSVEPAAGQNTVIGALVVERPLDHDALSRICVSGHAGIARVIRPAHSPVDGDSIFALSTERGSCSVTELMQLTTAAQVATARALINAVSSA